MDKELIREAVIKRLNKREMYVLVAQQLGITEVYDIQQFTGLRRDVVIEAAAQIMQVLHNRLINNISITLVSAQNMQTPPKQLMDHLYTSLKRSGTSNLKELTGCKRAYMQAYDHCNQDQTEAIQLVKDCIDVNLENLKHAAYPGLYLTRLFSTYLASLPEIPWEIRENAKLLRRHLRYDPKVRQYSLAGRI